MSKFIAIGSDHAGFALKSTLKSQLESMGFSVRDFGTNSDSSVDYPDFAGPLALAVNQAEIPQGVLICGSGQGVAMTANKFPNVRAALCRTVEDAQLSRGHNNANILCLGQRMTSPELAVEILKTFLNIPFEGGRHAARVEKMARCNFK